MGQVYSITTLSAGSAGIDVPELADLSYEKSLGNARFMKAIRARHRDGLVVAKVVMKPYPSFKLDEYVTIILREREILADIPNALGYHRILETSSNGYLVRQYLYSSLYDRMSTRPFLEDIEKRWLSFQLLCAVRDCHARNVYHGDIKSENVLVTSWNWLYLTDFSSSFKPTYLPEDNPANFSFFFDTSGRRTCYLAPERFLSAGQHAPGGQDVNWAMDIFSVGCVIAELFLETPVFSLAQLFRYRKGEYDPENAFLKKIGDSDLRQLIAHMIQLEPESRYSADEYLNFWRGKAFPEYFYSFLHQYMFLITDPTSGRAPITAGAVNMGESDERIERVYGDFDKISYFLGYSKTTAASDEGIAEQKCRKDMFPLHIDIPNNQHLTARRASQTVDDGTLIFLTLVVSSLRSTARARARVQACELLLAFAERVTDEAKLDRIVPYIIALLNDRMDIVKVAALRTMTQILALVSVVSPINAYIFPEYILPRLLPFIPAAGAKSSQLVRATYASCLATLATTASRFLDIMHALRAEGSLPPSDPEAENGTISDIAYQTLFDIARDDLMAQFEIHTKALLTDNDSTVRRAFLGSVSRLCVFFGSAKANDVILSHLNTYLNDKDWMLRCAFFETIVGVATYVGGTSLEDFILPLMIQALTDSEEFVVERVIRSLSSMALLGLFQRSKMWELVDIVGRFTMHPNLWIREAAAQFISSSTNYLSVADTHSIILPLVKPYTKLQPSDLSQLKLLDALKKPLPKLVLDMAAIWATKAERGVFWKPVKQQPTVSASLGEGSVSSVSARALSPRAVARTPKNDEDEQWMNRLRNAGMSKEDELKLLALREYIWKVARKRSKDDHESEPSRYNQIVALKDLGIAPQTVFFDQPPVNDQPSSEENKQLHTIQDALLDASTKVVDGIVNLGEDGKKSKNAATPTKRDRDISGPVSAGLNGTASPQSETDPQNKALKIPTANQKLPSSPGEPSSFGSSRNGKAAHNHAVQHKSSAINLLNKKDQSTKASAETSTTSTNAFGEVDGIAPRDQNAPDKTRTPVRRTQSNQSQASKIRYRDAHSYDGNDPHILRLLDTLYLENYPTDRINFGPVVTPVSGRQPIKQSSGVAAGMAWRPEGVFVGMLSEHTAAINQLVVAPDHLFFLTGSDDGSVKVWDSSRLERNVSYRARQTHKHSAGARVSSLTFVENTHCFVSSATDGTVQVVKVDYVESSGTTRYGKLKVLREYKLPEEEYAVWSEHFKADNQSILILATNKSRVIAIELRSMHRLYEFQNPLQHGTVTCFCVDRKHHSLLLGTAHGVLDLWDLRFQLRVKTWGLAGGSPIHRITLHPLRGSRKNKVVIAGGTGQGEVTVWDLEKFACREVYRVAGTKEPAKGYEVWNIEDEKPGLMLGRFASSSESSSNAGIDKGVRAIYVGMHVPEDGSDSRQSFLLSAGPDWKVRYWDMTRPEASVVVSGAQPEDVRPTYVLSQPTPDIVMVTERQPAGISSSTSTASSSGQKGASSASTKRDASKSTKSRVVSRHQQQLLRGHLDSVTDVALLEYPYGMVLSADRSGTVYVFQ